MDKRLTFSNFFRTLLAIFAFSVFVGCGFSSTSVESPGIPANTVAAQIESLKQSFVDAGLTAVEAKFIAEAMIAGGGGSTATNSTLVTYDKGPDMVEAGMVALTSTTFATDVRKLLAIPVLTSGLFSLFSDEVGALSEAALIDYSGRVLQAQVSKSVEVQMGLDKFLLAIKSMSKTVITETAPMLSANSAQVDLWREVAIQGISDLSALNLLNVNLEVAIENLAAGAFDATARLTGLSAGQKSELIIEYLATTFEELKSTGLTYDEQVEAARYLDDQVEAILAQDANLSGNAIFSEQLRSASQQGGACIATSKWVYMYEYSDSRCQTLVKKWLQAFVGTSPLNKGYPDHAFCYRDLTSGAYYNWLATDVGCTAPAEPIVFPANPSPRSLTTTPAAAQSCEYGAAGTETGSDGDSRDKCEGRGLAQFIAAGKTAYTEVYRTGVLIAVFDEANSGLTFPAVARTCSVKTSPAGVQVQATYLRTVAECIDWCELVISEDATAAYSCNLNGEQLATYSAGSVSAPTPPTIDRTIIFTTAPVSFNKEECTRVGLTLQLDVDNLDLAGQAKAFVLSSSRYFIDPATALPLVTYSESTCTRPATLLRLADGASEASVYVRVPSTATAVDLGVQPLFSGAAGSAVLGIPVNP